MTAVPRARVDVKSMDLGSEVLIYDEQSRKVHLLNSTARHIWQLCDGSHGVDDIVAEVARMFPSAPADELRADVERALDALLEKGVVVWVASEAESAR